MSTDQSVSEPVEGDGGVLAGDEGEGVGGALLLGEGLRPPGDHGDSGELLLHLMSSLPRPFTPCHRAELTALSSYNTW